MKNENNRFDEDTCQKRDFCLKKGIFPYEYIDSIEKLSENKLPPKEKFYSSLTEKGVSIEDYNHAKDFWKLFKCESLWDYALRYCKCNVIQLAQVFLDFCNTMFDWIQLDPCHYFGTPGLAYDIFLKKSKVSIEMMTDPQMV